MSSINKNFKFLPSIYNLSTLKNSTCYEPPTFTTDESTLKPYKCNICKNSFKRRSSVLRHQSIHFGEKQFECEYCLKSFNRKDTLDRHFDSRKCKRVKSIYEPNRVKEINDSILLNNHYNYNLPLLSQTNSNQKYEHSKHIYEHLKFEDIPDHPLLKTCKKK